MQIELSAQLRGIARLLREVVGPEVADPYVADVLQGAAATLDALSAGVPQLVPFLRWDGEASSALLRSVDVEPAPPPPEPADPAAVEAWHRDVRAQLDEAMPRLRAHDEASAATAAHFRERASRYPFVVRPAPPRAQG